MPNTGLRWGATKPPPGTQIDWQAPLSAGLAGCWLFNEGSGKLLNDLAGGVGGTASMAAGPVWKFPGGGPVLDGAVTGDVSVPSTARAARVGVPMSLLVWINGSTSDSLMIIEKAPVNTLWELFYFGGNVQWCGASGTNRLAAISPANAGIVAGQWRQVLIVDTGDHASLYVDGAFKISGTTGTAPSATAGTIHFGNFDGTTWFWLGMFRDIRIWNRALSAGEAEALYGTPYAGFWTPGLRFISLPRAAGSILGSPIIGSRIVGSPIVQRSGP